MVAEKELINDQMNYAELELQGILLIKIALF